MTSGRFFIHPIIQNFANLLVQKHCFPNEQAILVATHGAARRCVAFIEDQALLSNSPIRILDFVRAPHYPDSATASVLRFSAVVFPAHLFKFAKAFWQHTGEGVQSRRAEYCRREYEEGGIVERSVAEEQQRQSKGPKRYRKGGDLGLHTHPISPNGDKLGNGEQEFDDRARFVEERFGRNLNMDHADKAKVAARRRIAGSLTTDTELHAALDLAPDSARMRDVVGFSVDDVYLYPCGMNAIYSAHRQLLVARGVRKSICFGYFQVATFSISALLTAPQIPLHRHPKSPRKVRPGLPLLRFRQQLRP